VAWVTTPDYVAWVPLAPAELYYGRGYYGPHSVNITNINVNQVNVTNVYRNVNVNNSITVVNRNTFVTGRPVAVNTTAVKNIKDTMFLTRKINVAGPQIKPQASSYAPVVRQIPPAKLPPKAVQSIRVKEFKEVRPLVREQNKSVFNPRVQPRELEVKKIGTPRSLPERVKERRQSQPSLKKDKDVMPEGKGRIAPSSTPPPVKERKELREKPPVAPEGKGRIAPPTTPPPVKERKELREKPPVSPEGKGRIAPPTTPPPVKERKELREKPPVVPEGKGWIEGVKPEPTVKPPEGKNGQKPGEEQPK